MSLPKNQSWINKMVLLEDKEKYKIEIKKSSVYSYSLKAKPVFSKSKPSVNTELSL